MDSSWITPILCFLFIAGAMAVFKRWMGRQRLRSPAESDQLAHPPAILIVGLVGAVLFCGNRVDFNQLMNWYRLKLANGDSVRVSGTMMGLPTFARHVLDHVPQHRLDLQARPMLDRAAKGELHPL